MRSDNAHEADLFQRQQQQPTAAPPMIQRPTESHRDRRFRIENGFSKDELSFSQPINRTPRETWSSDEPPAPLPVNDHRARVRAQLFQPEQRGTSPPLDNHTIPASLQVGVRT